jgi:Ca2+-binding EF-hand superfamily protein
MRFTLFFLAIIGIMMPQTATSEILSATDKIVEKFMELDFDESGGVSLEEYKTMVLQRMNERFHEMDTNNDDEVSAEEYRAFWKAKKAQYYRPRR